MTMMGAGADAVAERAHGGEPVHAGQADVEHDRVEAGRVGDPQALLGRRGDLDVVPLVGEELAERPADARLVVDDQDAAHAAPAGVSRSCWSRECQAEAGLRRRFGSRRAARRARSATCWAMARPSPTPSGLLVTNGSHRESASSGGGPGPVVGDLDGDLVAVSLASRRTVPPGPAASMAFKVRFRTAAGRPTGRRRVRAAASAASWTS